MTQRSLFAYIAIFFATTSAGWTDELNASINFSNLELVSEYRIPSDATFKNVPFGGISGLDPTGDNGHYIALSDDRSEKGPARFYELIISVDETGQLGVEIESAITIQTPDGTEFAEKTVDPESARYAAETNSLYWVSEIDTDNQAMLRQMAMDGTHMRVIDLPKRLKNTEEGIGHVKSASLEALALSSDGKTLYTATENALQQDGPKANAVLASPVRILEIDTGTGETTAEYLYVTDPVGHVSQDAERPWSDNGLSELLSIGDGQFIAIERNGWHVGGFEFHFAIKAYLVNLEGATDISGIDGLATADVASVQPVTKTLLVDFSQLGLESVDNIEAVALGPIIDGKQSLIFASDNNFDGRQVSQFILMK